ncbi:multiple epidermal growth factor-like domains protein 9 [Ambystoma mexicanum]|uniref:multiple epidermal growth factor-like domains protein 9 n=1 Tax=Ambystoma mexicanum TaxID=8296 RepID=UPI0037E8CF0E
MLPPHAQGLLLLLMLVRGGSAAFTPAPQLVPDPTDHPGSITPAVTAVPSPPPTSLKPTESTVVVLPTAVPLESLGPTLPQSRATSALLPSGRVAPDHTVSPSSAPTALPTSSPTTQEGLSWATAAGPNSTNPRASVTAASPTLRTETIATETPGFFCNCSRVGSSSENYCNRTTGQCLCVLGYTGLHCDICDGGYYLNQTSELCLTCDCNAEGATNLFCDSSGKCECKPGVKGLKCDQCQDGYYRSVDSGCIACQCNTHSNLCDALTGNCIGCKGNTEGAHCEKCETSFYRNQNAFLTEDCLQCPCSTELSNGRCHLDSDAVICDQCNPGYVGPHCKECDNGYYMRDTICIKCDCNGNVDPLKTPRICDSATGACLNCINNTTGLKCELCIEGYVGEASARNCTKKEISAVTESRGSTTADINATRPSTFSTSILHTTLTPTTVLTTFSIISSDNTTSAVADVSWTQFNIIVLTVIIIVVVLLVGFVGAVYMYREYQNRKLNAPFWTIELKEDNISFSSYHDTLPNADVSGLLEDDGNEITPNGQLSLTTPIHNFKT